jgi:small GTP-binding protein
LSISGEILCELIIGNHFICMSACELKIVVIGAVAVGKTSITNRLQGIQFEEDYLPTIGAGYVPWRTVRNGRNVELQIWDTAGMERYRSLGPIYYRDAVAAVLVYDQGEQSSADALSKWLEAFRNTVKGRAYIAVVGNKDDLEKKAVEPGSMRSWAEQNNFDFFLTSAKTGNGVIELFETIADRLLEITTILMTPVKSTQLSDTKVTSSYCC